MDRSQSQSQSQSTISRKRFQPGVSIREGDYGDLMIQDNLALSDLPYTRLIKGEARPAVSRLKGSLADLRKNTISECDINQIHFAIQTLMRSRMALPVGQRELFDDHLSSAVNQLRRIRSDASEIDSTITAIPRAMKSRAKRHWVGIQATLLAALAFF